jgi:hypothetical protein
MTRAVSAFGLRVVACAGQVGLEQWDSLLSDWTAPVQVKKRRRWEQMVRGWAHSQQVRSSTSSLNPWKTVSAGQ